MLCVLRERRVTFLYVPTKTCTKNSSYQPDGDSSSIFEVFLLQRYYLVNFMIKYLICVELIMKFNLGPKSYVTLGYPLS